jgi:hypothetical protein
MRESLAIFERLRARLFDRALASRTSSGPAAEPAASKGRTHDCDRSLPRNVEKHLDPQGPSTHENVESESEAALNRLLSRSVRNRNVRGMPYRTEVTHFFRSVENAEALSVGRAQSPLAAVLESALEEKAYCRSGGSENSPERMRSLSPSAKRAVASSP